MIMVGDGLQWVEFGKMNGKWLEIFPEKIHFKFYFLEQKKG